jgi:hypothetical protein
MGEGVVGVRFYSLEALASLPDRPKDLVDAVQSLSRCLFRLGFKVGDDLRQHGPMRQRLSAEAHRMTRWAHQPVDSLAQGKDLRA